MKHKYAIPSGSLIEKYLPADYSDVYAFKTDNEKEITPDDVMAYCWTDFPVWISALFKLRNFLVKFVGLKGSNNNNLKEFEKCIRSSETYNFISVPVKSGNETVLFLTDKHLDAYISVYIESNDKCKTISAITLIKFKNNLGRVYFFIIRPFHDIIMKSMLKRTVNKITPR